MHSPALTCEKASITKSAPVAQKDERPPPIPVVRPRISLFLERFDNLAKNLPHTIPEADDDNKLAEFGQNPAEFDDKTIDHEDLWEEINPRLKRVLGWGTEAKLEDLI